MSSAPPVYLVKPPGRWPALDLSELWSYRELLYFLVWRDLKVRYKQTGLGALWILLQPLVATTIFSIVFGVLLKAPSPGELPYALFVLAALVPWNFFASSLTRASASLVGDAHMIRKVYFPRLLLPAAAALAGLVDLALSFLLLLGLMALYGHRPGLELLWLPCVLGVLLLLALGLGFWLASLNVRFRDVGYVVPFVIQIWMYATPVVYAAELIPERWRPLLALNPMVLVVDGFRHAVLGIRPESLSPSLVVVSLTASVLAFFGGALYLRRVEQGFADVV